MPTSAYFVTLETRDSVPNTDYARVAGTLTNALHMTLGDINKLCLVMHSVEFSDPRVEVEITQSVPAAIARCVVYAESTTKLTFDKNLFSTMVCAELPFPVKISKRAVSKDELIAMAALDEPPPEDAA